MLREDIPSLVLTQEHKSTMHEDINGIKYFEVPLECLTDDPSYKTINQLDMDKINAIRFARAYGILGVSNGSFSPIGNFNIGGEEQPLPDDNLKKMFEIDKIMEDGFDESFVYYKNITGRSGHFSAVRIINIGGKIIIFSANSASITDSDSRTGIDFGNIENCSFFNRLAKESRLPIYYVSTKVMQQDDSISCLIHAYHNMQYLRGIPQHSILQQFDNLQRSTLERMWKPNIERLDDSDFTSYYLPSNKKLRNFRVRDLETKRSQIISEFDESEYIDSFELPSYPRSISNIPQFLGKVKINFPIDLIFHDNKTAILRDEQLANFIFTSSNIMRGCGFEEQEIIKFYRNFTSEEFSVENFLDSVHKPLKYERLIMLSKVIDNFLIEYKGNNQSIVENTKKIKAEINRKIFQIAEKINEFKDYLLKNIEALEVGDAYMIARELIAENAKFISKKTCEFFQTTSPTLTELNKPAFSNLSSKLAKLNFEQALKIQEIFRARVFNKNSKCLKLMSDTVDRIIFRKALENIGMNTVESLRIIDNSNILESDKILETKLRHNIMKAENIKAVKIITNELQKNHMDLFKDRAANIIRC